LAIVFKRRVGMPFRTPPPATTADGPRFFLFYMKLNRQIAADVIQPSNQTVKH
jgi:hypothetical protein